MTANIAVEDVDLNGGANGQGTIGAINATIDWTSEGMRESANSALKEAIDEYLDGSIFGFLGDWISTDEVVTSVQTDPSTGIVTLEGMFDSSIAVKPETTADGGIKLEIQPDGFTLGGDLDLPAGRPTGEARRDDEQAHRQRVQPSRGFARSHGQRCALPGSRQATSTSRPATAKGAASTHVSTKRS